MAEDTDETTDPADTRETGTQTDLSPWESPHRSESDSDSDSETGTTSESDDTTTDETDDTSDSSPDLFDSYADRITGTTSTDTTEEEDGDEDVEDEGEVSSDADTDAAEETNTSELAGINWDRRELGEEYPVEADYHCNECNDFHSDTVRELKEHIEADEPITWGEYLTESNLHRCAGCGESLSTLADLYCDDCTQHPDDRIPCRNCGAVRVKVSDPFCSASCAGERIEATDGPPRPLDSPLNPSDDWLDHPHRLATGIPSGAPFIENHQLACRECYEYGSDDLHKFAVHVSEKHIDDGGWGAYIQTYAMRRCRVCGDPLDSLLPLYCSEGCQQGDPDPVKTCSRDGCDAAVERRQTYCSRECYTHSTRDAD